MIKREEYLMILTINASMQGNQSLALDRSINHTYTETLQKNCDKVKNEARKHADRNLS